MRAAPRTQRRPSGAAVATTAGIALYAAFAASGEWSTATEYVLVFVPVAVAAGVAVADGWLRAGPPDTSVAGLGTESRHRRIGVAVWLVLIAVTAYWQLSVWTSNPRETFPTFSSVVNLVMDDFPVRVAAWATWLGLGWFVVRR